MVYVDDTEHKFGRMIMCHMVADTLPELHSMAAQIGLARRWFQNKPLHPHYDICKTKRALAVSAGAIEITQRETIDVLREWRNKKPDDEKSEGRGGR